MDWGDDALGLPLGRLLVDVGYAEASFEGGVLVGKLHLGRAVKKEEIMSTETSWHHVAAGYFAL